MATPAVGIDFVDGVQSSVAAMTDTFESSELARKLEELRAAHRALDHQIAQLIRDGFADQLELQRLKKRKLALKDRIARMASDGIPDIIA